MPSLQLELPLAIPIDIDPETIPGDLVHAICLGLPELINNYNENGVEEAASVNGNDDENSNGNSAAIASSEERIITTASSTVSINSICTNNNNNNNDIENSPLAMAVVVADPDALVVFDAVIDIDPVTIPYTTEAQEQHNDKLDAETKRLRQRRIHCFFAVFGTFMVAVIVLAIFVFARDISMQP